MCGQLWPFMGPFGGVPFCEGAGGVVDFCDGVVGVVEVDVDATGVWVALAALEDPLAPPPDEALAIAVSAPAASNPATSIRPSLFLVCIWFLPAVGM